MATRTLKLPRAFTRDDGRERIAIPLWRGVLYALGAIAIGFVVMFVAMIVMIFAAVLITGNAPSTKPGHPVIAAAEMIFYAAGGWFAWRGLRRTVQHQPFRTLTRRDVRTIFIGIGALFVARIGMGIVLVLTSQTKHVQAGFEHFSVKASAPALTVLDVALNVIVLVLLAPLVEEIIFRGLLFGALAPRLGVLLAALVSALLFGLAHGDAVLFPSLAAVGLVNALVYARTGNLTTAVVLHALNNALGAAFLIAASFRPG